MDTQDNQLQAKPELSQVKQEICRRIAEGESLRTICKQPGFPCRDTVWRWRELDSAFDQTITRARQCAGDWHADKVAEIACCLEDGDYVGMDQVSAARVAIDSHKWAASKYYPKQYGDAGPRSLHQTLVTGDVTLVADEGQRQAMIQARDKFLTGKPVKLLDEGKPEA